MNNQYIKKIPQRHIADFILQLSSLLTIGIPIITALKIIEQSQEQDRSKKLINNIIKNIETGEALSSALKKYNHYFDKLFCSLVYLGEQSGKLEQILKYLASHLENSIQLKRKIIKALFYPCSVLLIALTVTIVMLLLVVPQFNEMFHSFGAELPPFTQFIINSSNWLQSNLFTIIVVTIIAILSIINAKHQSTKFAAQIEKLLLKIPLIGELIMKSNIARLTQMLAMAYNAGLPLTESLKLITNTISNTLYQSALISICKQISSGKTIQSAIKDNQLFTHKTIQMLSIGEESGTLEIMLRKIGEHYSEEVDYIIENLNNLLEPAIMVILSVVVGAIVAGMYLPIFKLGTLI